MRTEVDRIGACRCDLAVSAVVVIGALGEPLGHGGAVLGINDLEFVGRVQRQIVEQIFFDIGRRVIFAQLVSVLCCPFVHGADEIVCHLRRRVRCRRHSHRLGDRLRRHFIECLIAAVVEDVGSRFVGRAVVAEPSVAVVYLVAVKAGRHSGGEHRKGLFITVPIGFSYALLLGLSGCGQVGVLGAVRTSPVVHLVAGVTQFVYHVIDNAYRDGGCAGAVRSAGADCRNRQHGNDHTDSQQYR